MRVILAGANWLGCEVLALCGALNVDVVAVVVPDLEDKLALRGRAAGFEVYRHKDLDAVAQMGEPDIILAAHCHGFVSAKARGAARLGCLAYHPSLLPRHRGRDAIEWAIRFGDKVAGGSLYWMDDGPTLVIWSIRIGCGSSPATILPFCGDAIWGQWGWRSSSGL